jgi:uncharacterized protein YdeI (YjbR/CyaY-like superfamily)
MTPTPKSTTPKAEKPILRLSSAQEWWDWLASNHATSDGVRLALVKKGSQLAGVSRDESLDPALCFGWIDGQGNRLDDDFFLVAYQPRRPRSIWSKINCDHVARLIKEGRMQPSGFAEIERAKADGRWEKAYESSSTMVVPDDLAEALAASPAAREFFSTLTAQNRYAILFRTHNVKRAETRARKIAEYVAMLERGETIYPQKR